MAKEVGNQLKTLEIDSCPRITEFGLAHLKGCRALRSLSLQNLKHVHGKEKALQELRSALPDANIKFP